MIVQCAKCRVHYENGMPPIALSAAGHSCVFEPVVVSAPPNDASGGVTEDVLTADFHALRERIDLRFRSGNDTCVERAGVTIDEWMRLRSLATKGDRSAIEAADRARKPGYRQPTYDDAVLAFEEFADNEIEAVAAMLAALQHIGAVIPEHAPGGEADRG